ncbi:alpha/beta fold hydrolase [Streptomyces sp. NPDC050161]|uniref:alpha/beta fold hydrolase n=1 Tax=Streptomyces sp. NPDC050161 TaxID=3365604 RepID=UPI0037AD1EEF
MANVVLVHGAWGDESVWDGVTAALQDQGHRVLAVRLPMTSLEADLAWTRQQLATVDGPVTLVGHSYGGVVISAVAHRSAQVTALVFVAAYAPDAAESSVTLNSHGGERRGRAAIRFGEDGWTTLDPGLCGEAFGPDLPEATVKALAASQRPTHLTCFATPSGPGAWHDLPCAYVISADDQIFDPGLQRWLAERTHSTVTELNAGHFSQISRPDEVAAAICAMLGDADPAGVSTV